MQVSNCAVGKIVDQRDPILLFNGRREQSDTSGAARNSLSDVCDLVLAGGSQSTLGTGAGSSFYHVWRDLESAYNSCSIGIVAATAPETDVVTRIISEGISGGPMPGAIALTRFDAAFVDLCRRLSGSTHVPSTASARMSGMSVSATPFEWPPMIVFLQMGDPDILACANACRTLRAKNVPISLEIVASGDNVDDASRRGVRCELEKFFATHLVPVFPKLF